MFRPIAALAFLAVARAAVDVIAPGPDVWWVAGSNNLLIWECNDNDVIPRYTVFATHPDKTILTDRTPLIAELDNTQCSHEITQGEVAPLRPAQGYIIQMCDPLNNTHILGVSQPFEVKAANSPYSTVQKTPKPRTQDQPSQTTSGSGSGSTNTPGNGAAKTGASALAALGAVALGMLFLA
ncbi:hypothetical protein AURDEDRAFT_187498 [Auricularia subglabra TFB-10046 SS5]|nr:hypothetical protein AURDEDRAFT_187498 [Auricularia subglabra TFB-10046 SS5]